MPCWIALQNERLTIRTVTLYVWSVPCECFEIVNDYLLHIFFSCKPDFFVRLHITRISHPWNTWSRQLRWMSSWCHSKDNVDTRSVTALYPDTWLCLEPSAAVRWRSRVSHSSVCWIDNIEESVSVTSSALILSGHIPQTYHTCRWEWCKYHSKNVDEGLGSTLWCPVKVWMVYGVPTVRLRHWHIGYLLAVKLIYIITCEVSDGSLTRYRWSTWI